MDGHDSARLRAATLAEGPALLALWALLFDDDDQPGSSWRTPALDWYAEMVTAADAARFPVVEVGGQVVATAIGTLELGVPNPQCVQGRVVRLANVITAPEHRGVGYGSLLVDDVVTWAVSIRADRVDLSATPGGQRIYARAGFVLTSAPRMKLVL